MGGGKIGDTIWRDWNGNGSRTRARKASRRHLDSIDRARPTASTTTDTNGLYFFTGLEPGTYQRRRCTPSRQPPPRRATPISRASPARSARAATAAIVLATDQQIPHRRLRLPAGGHGDHRRQGLRGIGNDGVPNTRFRRRHPQRHRLAVRGEPTTTVSSARATPWRPPPPAMPPATIPSPTWPPATITWSSSTRTTPISRHISMPHIATGRPTSSPRRR